MSKNTESLTEKLAQLAEKSPRDAKMVEAFVDVLLKEPRIPTGNRCNRWAFISHEEYDVFTKVCESLKEIAMEDLDMTDAAFPQDTLLLLHDAMSQPVHENLSNRFTLFSDYEPAEV
jgi:hypothetical protein